MILTAGEEAGNLAGEQENGGRGPLGSLVSFFFVMRERDLSHQGGCDFPEDSGRDWKHIWDQESGSQLSCFYSVLVPLIRRVA